MSESIVIYGCGGHSRSVADVLLFNNPEIDIEFIDKNARPDEIILGYPVLKYHAPDKISRKFVAIGDNVIRRAMSKELGVTLDNVISATANISSNCTIQNGVFVGHQAYIGPMAKIGQGAIINTRAIVEHEVTIGEYTQIAPGVIIGGRTNIGDLVFVGLGAIIIDGIKICNNAVIGAGAVVISDINTPGTYVGIPATKTK